MASKGDKTTGLNLVMALAVVLAMLCAQATAQSGCTSALKGLTPCLSFVTGCSSAPSSSCCSELASLVQSHPQCLHTVLDDVSLSFDVTLNQEKILSGNLALKLPSACIVQTLVSKCNGEF
ncbi:non-specific lipid transfer protein GPI-anchored 19-like [Eucalyptus grandis]|uniref:non-specific lipid transfer protein GPI-anchored 19-like n=1 Tax=Eucalyptus grandis TaxID=71139 RepID=UPI00192EE6A0|nr:non-specific lipid transfer protein GPI-anchored 19-like [Eucalyptus grandis]